MVPPPDTTGEEFPDFDDMTPEEQMAWLESLARRQGARPDEFTTAADLDIPMPDDATPDEPGYVPFEGSRSGREWAKSHGVSSSQPAQTPEEEPEEVEEDVELVAFDDVDEVGDEGDPMKWLDMLAAQPGAALEDEGLILSDEEEQLEPAAAKAPVKPAAVEQTGAIAEASDDEDEAAKADQAAGAPEMPAGDAAQPDAAIAAQAGASEEDLLGGADPIAWLETLARRQGADTQELTTSADLEIGDVPEDAVVDEPGYVPFEGSRTAREWGLAPRSGATEFEEEAEPEEQAEQAAARLPGEESSVEEQETELTAELGLAGAEESGAAREEMAAVEEWEASLGGADDPLAGADPLTWLESLARRQGAQDDELMTAADLEIPQPPENAEIDEPGYVAYSALEILPPDQDVPAEIRAEAERMAAEAEEQAPDEIALFEYEGEFGDDALAWLEEIAAEPEADAAAYLAAGAPGASDLWADPLAGFSDEDLAQLQASGALTGEQELAWLKRQAAELAGASERSAEQGVETDEAQPAEVPGWLADLLKEQDIAEAADLFAELDELAEELGVPDWLSEATGQGQTVEPREAAAEPESEEAPGGEPTLAEPVVAESELEAFLEAGLKPAAGEADSLAEALDDEYERMVAGDESEPDWYTEAVSRAASEETVARGPALTAAELVDVPGWLSETEEEAAAPGDEVAQWLAESGGLPEAEMPDWLVQRIVEAEPGTEGAVLEEWLSELDQPADETHAAEPAPSEGATTKPTARPALADFGQIAVEHAGLPGGPQYEPLRQRLEANPEDHPARLRLARTLRDNRSWAESLDQYEALVGASRMLDEVSRDLQTLAAEQGRAPRVQRLLGDAHMRSGRLQEALDAYREALDQL